MHSDVSMIGTHLDERAAHVSRWETSTTAVRTGAQASPLLAPSAVLLAGILPPSAPVSWSHVGISGPIAGQASLRNPRTHAAHLDGRILLWGGGVRVL